MASIETFPDSAHETFELPPVGKDMLVLQVMPWADTHTLERPEDPILVVGKVIAEGSAVEHDFVSVALLGDDTDVRHLKAADVLSVVPAKRFARARVMAAWAIDALRNVHSLEEPSVLGRVNQEIYATLIKE